MHLHRKIKISLQLFLWILLSGQAASAQRGYYDAPYKRYEADEAALLHGAFATVRSYAQSDVQSEASGQVCVNMDSSLASIDFVFSDSANGLVLRYCVPDSQVAKVALYDGDTRIDTLILTSKWSWEYLWNNGDPNNVGVVNKNPKMRFDEVRYHLPFKTNHLKIVKESGSLWLDFAEMESVPPPIDPPEGAVVYNGEGSGLQAFIDAHGGQTIFIPEGKYDLPGQLYFGVNKTSLQGAGMWYTQFHFTVTNASNGGLRANAMDVSYADLYLTSDLTSRTNGYSGILGVYTSGSLIRNIWAEHFAAGAWIAQYVTGGPAYADGFRMTNCRFRDTYADGINLCKGTRNAIVEHCNFRNNGDDGQAIWCAEGLECINNTFRFNTVENGWRAAGAALYGGRDNKFYSLIIRDNLETGITVSNIFTGVGFNASGMHDFHDITLQGCGTFNDCYNKRTGAINIVQGSSAGTRVQNVKLYHIDILDSKNDAIRIFRNSGAGTFNFIFENITVNGTGREYPFNNADSSAKGRGYVAVFDNKPYGSASYCNLNFSNLGGTADTMAFDKSDLGTFKWNALTGCDYIPASGILVTPSDTTLAGGASMQLNVNFIPANATNKTVDFVSLNPAVLEVNSAGFVSTFAKGTADVLVTSLDGQFMDTCHIIVKSDPTLCYRIKNRWQNTYLYDADTITAYSTSAKNNTFLWIEEDSAGMVRFRNLATKDYMHIRDLSGFVQSTPISAESAASWWITEDAGSGFIRIQSAMDTSFYIHIENLKGKAQYGTISDSWWSAMWSLEPVMVVTSVTENLSASEPATARVYPNPTSGQFSFILQGFSPNEKITVQLFNLNGITILNKEMTAGTNGTIFGNFNEAETIKPGYYLLLARGKVSMCRTMITITK